MAVSQYLPELSPEGLRQVSHFERDLVEGSSIQGIAAYLSPDHQGEEAVTLFQHLLHVHVQHRVQQGDIPKPDEYKQDFPHFAEPIDRLFSLLLTVSTVDLQTVHRHGAEEAPIALQPPGYEIMDKLGRGGMAVVYKARQTQLQRLVALKMILHGDYAEEHHKQRFYREAEAVARLRHVNIVQIYEIGQHQGQPYLALEYCDGGSLKDKLRNGPLAAPAAGQVVETLARAVAVAHQQRIVHRDLKPGNVLLTADGTLKITDFGLARELGELATSQQDALTASGVVIGTPSYMAPEQARGEPVGPTADVYALGVILYELLTGQPPFRAATMLDTLHHVQDTEPVPLRRLQPRTPRDLETICLKCLQKEPSRRYASALALADDLRRFAAGEPIDARPVGRLERAWKWARRRPAAAALIALLLMLVFGGSGAAIWYANDRADREIEAVERRARERNLKMLVSTSVNVALIRAQAARDDLQAELARPGGVFKLLDRPKEWASKIEAAQALLQDARDLLRGISVALEPALAEQIQTLAAELRG